MTSPIKILFWISSAFLLVILSFLIINQLASERIEVVQLHTLDKDGSEKITRLWVVDYEGYAYLRSGDENSGWYNRLMANPVISLTRNEQRADYRFATRSELKQKINQLMKEKYTWGDRFFDIIFGNRSSAIPIQLIGINQVSEDEQVPDA